MADRPRCDRPGTEIEDECPHLATQFLVDVAGYRVRRCSKHRIRDDVIRVMELREMSPDEWAVAEIMEGLSPRPIRDRRADGVPLIGGGARRVPESLSGGSDEGLRVG